MPWKSISIAVAICVGLTIAYQQIDVEALHAKAAGLNGAVAFLLLTVLPLVGFPVTILHLAAGIRFGTTLGVILVPVSILLHLLASYAIVHFWHKALAKRFEKVRKKIPHGAHGPVCLFTLLLPGVPYFAKNYVLPLIGVPLRTYLLWCFPIHTARCIAAVILGAKSDDLTPGRLIVLGAYFVTLLGVSWWTFRRLRTQLANRRSAAGGRKQLA